MCSAGDAHGRLDTMYTNILSLEKTLGVKFDWILHVGDLGVWPDPDKVDKATRKHGDVGDFPSWLASKRAAPKKTVFIKGNHEDFDWLDSRVSNEILPNLFYLKNGTTMKLETRDETITVGGVGGCFSPSDFERNPKSFRGKEKRHYARVEINALSRRNDIDVIITHDAPTGVTFDKHRRGFNWTSDALGLDELIASTHPRVCFFGHHHTKARSTIREVDCVGLNRVGMPGNLCAFELNEHEREWKELGEL